jgi:hypothetical protein
MRSRETFLVPARVRTPNRPVRSESLYRLSFQSRNTGTPRKSCLSATFPITNSTFSGVIKVIKNLCTFSYINLLKSTACVMHQVNIQEFYFRPHCMCVFCIYLRTNSDYCPIQHKLIGFYNRNEKCLLRGTNWVFK